MADCWVGSGAAAACEADEAAGPSGSERVLPFEVRDFWEDCAAEAEERASPLYFNLAESEEDTSDAELEFLTVWLRRIQAVATGILSEKSSISLLLRSQTPSLVTVTSLVR